MAISLGKFGASITLLVMCWLQEETALQHKTFHLSNFLLMFPPKQLTDMVRWTNMQLQKSSMKETMPSEVLKFFGILIPTTVHVKNIFEEYDGMIQVLTGISVQVERHVKKQIRRPVQLHEMEFSTCCSYF
jgi:hypothetical protein